MCIRDSYVPEQFNTSNPEAEGISTAKILALAASQGQKIYTITNANLDDLNNIIVGDGGMNEIEEALSNNLEVMIHEEPITAFGWQGSGYMIIDPDSGAGAYKISGGANGGFIDFDHASYIWILGLVASFAAPLVSVLAAKILVISAVLATALLVADAVVNYSRLPAEATSSGTAALLAVGLIVTVVAVFNVGVVAALGMLLMSILLVNMVLELLNDIAETLPAIKN